MCDPAITDHYRVIAFDLPWHGKSSPPVGWRDREYRLTTDLYVQRWVSATRKPTSLTRPSVSCGPGSGGGDLRLPRYDA
jgi:pimeloyl-ACP methyl ester carboxylesterase